MTRGPGPFAAANGGIKRGLSVKRTLILLVVSAVAGVVFSVTSAPPARASLGFLWLYPGTSCTTTLQACIDGASAGDTIELDANDLSTEFAAVNKTLTIAAAAGYSPILYGVDVYDSDPTPMIVNLSGFTVTNYIEATFSNGGGDSLAISHVAVAQTESSASSGPGISLDAEVPSSFSVTSSHISFTNEWAGISAYNNSSGAVSFQAIGNYITAHGATYAGSGIELDTSSTGSMQADIMNNAIWDVANCNCGGASGAFVYPQATSTMNVNFVGNTFQRVHSSDIGVRNELLAGGIATVNVYNNIFAHTTQAAIDLDDSGGIVSRLAYHAGTNDEFNNGFPDFLDGRSAGSGNLVVNPLFVSPSTGNLHLKSTSPLIDKGQVCSPGGVAISDAAGNSRVFGSSVDLGAYERGAGAPTGQVFIGGSGSDTITGTSGADIICGMGGNDTLNGGGGNDFIDGGNGNDKVVGGGGADWLYGGSGNDTLCAKDGTGGNDHVNGGSGTDGYQIDGGDFAVNVEHKVTC